MALQKRIHNPFAVQQETLYMIIDVTTLEGTNVLKVGNMRRCQLLGALRAAEGKQVMAPPIEARGLAKLSADQIKYLYWNLTKQSPDGVEDIGEAILAAVNEMEPCDEHIPSLEFLVSQLETGVQPLLNEDGTAAPKPIVRPKGTTTTGIIWTICDEVLAELFKGAMPADTKALRAEAFKRCDAEGFHSGTFGVQYGKWKNSKLSAVPT